jgi:serine/threonine protein kinase
MKIDQTLGRYQIKEFLGRGGYADVYRAEDTVLGRTVALKVLQSGRIADSGAFARFIQEAKVGAQLQHPHIAWVWDIGDSDGFYYIAMRYVNGPALNKKLKESSVEWEAAKIIFAQLASGLQFAHDNGFIHRDIKPQNILISEEDGAVLTDFGLVKAMASSIVSTQTNAIVGTPDYIAPEIWEEAPASTTSDQYALACVFLEIITGHSFFSASNSPAIMRKHFKPRDFSNLEANVPDAFLAILNKALDPDPAERFNSITEMAEAIETISILETVDEIFPEQSSESEIVPVDEDIESSQEVVTPQPIAAQKADIQTDFEWIDIKPGIFKIGPKKQAAKIKYSYQISKYPITNAQYKVYLDATPEISPPDYWDHRHRIYPPKLEFHPVVMVSREDALRYCQWAACRLPTRVEWERVARYTDGRVFPWGNKWRAGSFCNSHEASIHRTIPVDYFSSGVSPEGAWDLCGNVWEWTMTIEEQDRDLYFLCGGSFLHDIEMIKAYSTIKNRSSFKYPTIGFRVIKKV